MFATIICDQFARKKGKKKIEKGRELNDFEETQYLIFLFPYWACKDTPLGTFK